MILELTRPNNHTARISWTENSRAKYYILIVRNLTWEPIECWEYKVPQNKQNVRLLLESGDTYRVVVEAYNKSSPKPIEKTSIRFRADFTEKEMDELFDKATDFVNKGKGFNPIKFLFRVKPAAYFNHIMMKENGIMETYIKDNSGDRASTINRSINGLFFSSHISQHTNRVPVTSPFGDTQLLIPAKAILKDADIRLYFADFYCLHYTHHLTLVLTYNESEADDFCAEKGLINVDLYDNDFFVMCQGRLFVTKRLNVEILYTEDIDIPAAMSDWGASFRQVDSRLVRKLDGLPKNVKCDECNLDITRRSGKRSKPRIDMDCQLLPSEKKNKIRIR